MYTPSRRFKDTPHPTYPSSLVMRHTGASSPACAGHAHEGMPDTWAFDWLTTQPLPPARER